MKIKSRLHPTNIMLMLLTSPCAQAALTMDESRVLELPVAEKGLTRITVDEDKIQDIFVYPNASDNLQLHKSGHVFIVGDGLKAPLFLTLITTTGATQDLKIIPKARTTAPIILKRRDKEEKSQESEAHLSALLTTFAQGRIPPGFRKVSLAFKNRLKGDLKASAFKAYTNSSYAVLVFNVAWEGATPLVLDPSLLSGRDDMALTFDKRHLMQDETATLYVIQRLQH